MAVLEALRPDSPRSAVKIEIASKGKRLPEHEPRASLILQADIFQFVFRTRIANCVCEGANWGTTFAFTMKLAT